MLKHLLLMLAPLLHDLRLKLAALRHQLIEEFDILNLYHLLFVTVGV